MTPLSSTSSEPGSRPSSASQRRSGERRPIASITRSAAISSPVSVRIPRTWGTSGDASAPHKRPASATPRRTVTPGASSATAATTDSRIGRRAVTASKRPSGSANSFMGPRKLSRRAPADSRAGTNSGTSRSAISRNAGMRKCGRRNWFTPRRCHISHASDIAGGAAASRSSMVTSCPALASRVAVSRPQAPLPHTTTLPIRSLSSVPAVGVGPPYGPDETNTGPPVAGRFASREHGTEIWGPATLASSTMNQRSFAHDAVKDGSGNALRAAGPLAPRCHFERSNSCKHRTRSETVKRDRAADRRSHQERRMSHENVRLTLSVLADDDHLGRDVRGVELAIDPELARLVGGETELLRLVRLDDVVDVERVDAEPVRLVGRVADVDVDLVALGDRDRADREARLSVDARGVDAEVLGLVIAAAPDQEHAADGDGHREGEHPIHGPGS